MAPANSSPSPHPQTSTPASTFSCAFTRIHARARGRIASYSRAIVSRHPASASAPQPASASCRTPASAPAPPCARLRSTQHSGKVQDFDKSAATSRQEVANHVPCEAFTLIGHERLPKSETRKRNERKEDLLSAIISHHSALRLTRVLGPKPALPYSRMPSFDKCTSSQELARGLIRQFPILEGEPVNFLVNDRDARLRTDVANSHLHTNALPPRSLVAVAEDIYRCTPEFCFVQLAPLLSLPKLVQVGFELCSSYALTHDDVGFRKRPAVTSPRAIERFCEDNPSLRGSAIARKAVKHVIEGSASPRESVLTMLLCMPTRYGGYAFPKPKLNAPIETVTERGRLRHRQRFVCDLFWPELKLAAEYDSQAFHQGERKIVDDQARAAAIGSSGITVVSIRGGQIDDPCKFQTVVADLNKKAGRRQRIQSESFREKERNLRSEILRPENDVW